MGLVSSEGLLMAAGFSDVYFDKLLDLAFWVRFFLLGFTFRMYLFWINRFAICFDLMMRQNQTNRLISHEVRMIFKI